MKDEIVMFFSINGYECSANNISEIIGIEPDKIRIKGEFVNSRTRIRYEENSWILSSGLSKQASFEEHANSLVSRLIVSLDKLKIICDQYETQIECAVYFYENESGSLPSVHFTSENIVVFGELNASIDIDLYVL